MTNFVEEYQAAINQEKVKIADLITEVTNEKNDYITNNSNVATSINDSILKEFDAIIAELTELKDEHMKVGK